MAFVVPVERSYRIQACTSGKFLDDALNNLIVAYPGRICVYKLTEESRIMDEKTAVSFPVPATVEALELIHPLRNGKAWLIVVFARSSIYILAWENGTVVRKGHVEYKFPSQLPVQVTSPSIAVSPSNDTFIVQIGIDCVVMVQLKKISETKPFKISTFTTRVKFGPIRGIAWMDRERLAILCSDWKSEYVLAFYTVGTAKMKCDGDPIDLGYGSGLSIFPVSDLSAVLVFFAKSIFVVYGNNHTQLLAECDNLGELVSAIHLSENTFLVASSRSRLMMLKLEIEGGRVHASQSTCTTDHDYTMEKIILHRVGPSSFLCRSPHGGFFVASIDGNRVREQSRLTDRGPLVNIIPFPNPNYDFNEKYYQTLTDFASTDDHKLHTPSFILLASRKESKSMLSKMSYGYMVKKYAHVYPMRVKKLLVASKELIVISGLSKTRVFGWNGTSLDELPSYMQWDLNAPTLAASEKIQVTPNEVICETQSFELESDMATIHGDIVVSVKGRFLNMRNINSSVEPTTHEFEKAITCIKYFRDDQLVASGSWLFVNGTRRFEFGAPIHSMEGHLACLLVATMDARLYVVSMESEDAPRCLLVATISGLIEHGNGVIAYGFPRSYYVDFTHGQECTPIPDLVADSLISLSSNHLLAADGNGIHFVVTLGSQGHILESNMNEDFIASVEMDLPHSLIVLSGKPDTETSCKVDFGISQQVLLPNSNGAYPNQLILLRKGEANELCICTVFVRTNKAQTLSKIYLLDPKNFEVLSQVDLDGYLSLATLEDSSGNCKLLMALGNRASILEVQGRSLEFNSTILKMPSHVSSIDAWNSWICLADPLHFVRLKKIFDDATKNCDIKVGLRGVLKVRFLCGNKLRMLCACADSALVELEQNAEGDVEEIHRLNFGETARVITPYKNNQSNRISPVAFLGTYEGGTYCYCHVDKDIYDRLQKLRRAYRDIMTKAVWGETPSFRIFSDEETAIIDTEFLNDIKELNPQTRKALLRKAKTPEKDLQELTYAVDCALKF